MLEQLTKDAYQVFLPDGSSRSVKDEPQSPSRACELLEAGGVLYFPKSPFKRSQQASRFLLGQHQNEAARFKNIAYRPMEDRVKGAKNLSREDYEKLREIMSEFSQQTVEFLDSFLSPYKGHYKLDYASYRPIEEKGRKMRLRARNDLIHVDSFPTRPTFGDRILRVFENVNPRDARVWQNSETFDILATQYRGIRKSPRSLDSSSSRKSDHGLFSWVRKKLGLKGSSASGYDTWMMDFHNFLKESSQFQSECPKARWEFEPGSTWLVYTDMVSHSVLSGQFALEQTFIVSHEHMVTPAKAPINILRNLYNL